MFSLNVWSSGIWISTGTGSTAAMHAAGGTIMDIHSPNIQFMVREHLVERGLSYQKKAGQGIISMLQLWIDDRNTFKAASN